MIVRQMEATSLERANSAATQERTTLPANLCVYVCVDPKEPTEFKS